MAISTTKSIKKNEDFTAKVNLPKELKSAEKVTLYIESGADSSPVPVCINGYTIVIPKSTEVIVPAPYADVLMSCGFKCHITKAEKKSISELN